MVQDFAPPVINQHDVEGFAILGFAVVGGVAGYGLPRARACEQAGEYSQRFVVGHHLLYADNRDVEVWECGAHIGITLVGAYHYRPAFRNGKIPPGHRDVGMQEPLP